MNPFQRWLKFNLVGAIGMAVQLLTLALLNRLWRGHYLLASAAALELTLLHNFFCHTHYTWRDRGNGGSRLGQLMRFHASNGFVSLIGNLALMRLLVGGAHLPVLLANVVAVLCCSVANFQLGNRWTFGNPRPSPSLVALLAFLSLPAGIAAQTSAAQQGSAEQSTSLPDAPKSAPRPAYHPSPSDSYYSNSGAFCGLGSTTSSAASRPAGGCGVGITFVPLPLFLEVGMMAPQANRSYVSGYISVDGHIPLATYSTKYMPQAILGYSRLFETGHSLDYGLALAMPRPRGKPDDSRSLRLELRDYWTFANPSQHNIMLRVGWMEPVYD